jgi:hypothetical protein
MQQPTRMTSRCVRVDARLAQQSSQAGAVQLWLLLLPSRAPPSHDHHLHLQAKKDWKFGRNEGGMTWPWKLCAAILYMLPWVDVTEKTVYFIERFPAFHWTEYFTGVRAWGRCLVGDLEEHERSLGASVGGGRARLQRRHTLLRLTPLPHPHTPRHAPPTQQSRLSTGFTSTSGRRSSSFSAPTSASCATRRSLTSRATTS